MIRRYYSRLFIYLSKLRQSRDFKSPSLIIAKVEMKFVQFVHSHSIQQFKQPFFRLEISRSVNHDPSIAESAEIMLKNIYIALELLKVKLIEDYRSLVAHLL